MYQVSFDQVYQPIKVDSSANECPDGYPVTIMCEDLERALAIANVLQRASTPAVLNYNFNISEYKPVKID